MNVNDLYPSDYLKAADLKGREVLVIIDRIEMADMRDGNQKPCVYFRGKEKGLILNKTNGMTIADFYGPESDGWIGHAITLGTSWVDFNGKQVESIRVRPIRPAAQQPTHFQSAPPHQPSVTVQADPNAGAYLEDDSIPF